MPVDVNRFMLGLMLQGSLIGSNGARQDVSLDQRYNFTDGYGANQAGNCWVVKSGTVAAAGTASIDASGWTDFSGTAVAPTNVKAFIVVVTSVTVAGGTLLVSAGAANHLATMFPDASKGAYIRGKGFLALASPEEGYAVTAGTGDLLLLTAATATFTYDLYMLVGV
jgi:hypothetical protein